MSIFAPVSQSGKKNIADLQRLVNLTGFGKLKVDGVIGPRTLDAINSLPSDTRAVLDEFARVREIPYPRFSQTPRISEKDKTLAEKIELEAIRQGVNPKFALAVAQIESDLNPFAKSPTGAAGLFQLTDPAIEDVTKVMGVPSAPNGNEFDIDWNIKAGVSYLKLTAKRVGVQPTTTRVDEMTDIYAAYNVGIGNFWKLQREEYDDKSLLDALSVQAQYLIAGGPRKYLPAIQSKLESVLV